MPKQACASFSLSSLSRVCPEHSYAGVTQEASKQEPHKLAPFDSLHEAPPLCELRDRASWSKIVTGGRARLQGLLWPHAGARPGKGFESERLIATPGASFVIYDHPLFSKTQTEHTELFELSLFSIYGSPIVTQEVYNKD